MATIRPMAEHVEAPPPQYVAYTLLSRRSGLAAAPDRGADRGQGGVRRGRRGLAGADAILTYSVVGVRPEADFFLWKLTERYDDLRDLAADLNGTPLAGWLSTPHSYLASTLLLEVLRARPEAPAAADRAAPRPVPRRLPVREAAALVLALDGGSPARDAGARGHRQPLPRRSRTTRRTRSGSTTRSS